MKSIASDCLERVRKEKPLVHHLTNWVTIYDCANIVKVFGASPVMAHAREEVAEMAGIASALVLNIGTLTTDFVDAMILAGKSANQKGIPVVLDVCGAGATKFRDDKCFEILDEVRVSIIKGNSSEIARIAGESVQTRGVDASTVEKNLQRGSARTGRKKELHSRYHRQRGHRGRWKKSGIGEERPPHDGKYCGHGMHGHIGNRHLCRRGKGLCWRLRSRSCLLRGRRRNSSRTGARGRAASKKSFLMPCTILMPKR